MFFPTLDTLATKNVIFVNREQSINDAVALMNKHGIRNVIVKSLEDFYILTASDLIRFKVDGVSYDTHLGQVPLCMVPQVPYKTNILDAIDLFVDGVDYICLKSDDGALFGIVSYTDIARNIDPDILIKKQRIGEVLRDEHLVIVQIVAPTIDVFEEMKARNQNAAIVFDGLNPIGILTQKDVITLLSKGQPINLPVSKYMLSPLITVPDSFTVQEAIRFSQKNKLKRIVVRRNDGNILGICDQKDLINVVYSKWARLVKGHQRELKEIGEILVKREKSLGLMVDIDALTGLYSAQMFSRFFTRELAQKKRYRTALSLIVFNIDHFKNINDSIGHIAGDEVLKKIARITLDKIRASDIVARWGDSEFAILLPNTPISGAKITAEKIRKEIANCAFEIPVEVTASFGIAESLDSDSMESVVQRAFEAMTEAKNKGRNQVVFEQAQ